MATRDQIKAYFQTGDTPTQSEFEEFLDSIHFFENDGVYKSASTTLTHSQIIDLVGTPVAIATIPADKYGNIVSVLLEKDFTTGYTLGNLQIVIKAGNDTGYNGQSVYLDLSSYSILLDQSGQRAVVHPPDSTLLQMFGGDIHIINTGPDDLSGGHADNVLKVTVNYILNDKL